MSGKSTFLSAVCHGHLDNGHGSARLDLLRHRHEILDDGRTSSISYHFLLWNSDATLWKSAGNGHHPSPLGPSENELLSEDAHWPFGSPNVPLHDHPATIIHEEATALDPSQPDTLSDPHVIEHIYRSSTNADANPNPNPNPHPNLRSCPVLFLDTPGSEKYLDKTLLACSFVPFSFLTGLVVAFDTLSSPLPLSSTFETLLKLCAAQQARFFIIVSKLDLANEPLEWDALINTRLAPSLASVQRKPFLVHSHASLAAYARVLESKLWVPVLPISNVTGANVALFRKLMFIFSSLYHRHTVAAESCVAQPNTAADGAFLIEDIFSIPMVGTVVLGHITQGRVEMADPATMSTSPQSQHHVASLPSQLVSSPSQPITLPRSMPKPDGMSMPLPVPVLIASMHRYRVPVLAAGQGEYVSLLLPGLSKSDICKGQLIFSKRGKHHMKAHHGHMTASTPPLCSLSPFNSLSDAMTLLQANLYMIYSDHLELQPGLSVPGLLFVSGNKENCRLQLTTCCSTSLGSLPQWNAHICIMKVNFSIDPSCTICFYSKQLKAFGHVL